jgi:hypothetical protein
MSHTGPEEPRRPSIRATLTAGAVLCTALLATVRPNPLDRLGWLAGCWELKQGARTTLEMWMPPDGGLMLGASRTTVNGAVREFEQVRLRAEGGRLIYTALPSSQAEASFTSTELSDSGFTVENLQHDFPQRIIYRRRGADSLVARIEGPGPSGTRGLDFPMRRASCTMR